MLVAWLSHLQTLQGVEPSFVCTARSSAHPKRVFLTRFSCCCCPYGLFLFCRFSACSQLLPSASAWFWLYIFWLSLELYLERVCVWESEREWEFSPVTFFFFFHYTVFHFTSDMDVGCWCECVFFFSRFPRSFLSSPVVCISVFLLLVLCTRLSLVLDFWSHDVIVMMTIIDIVLCITTAWLVTGRKTHTPTNPRPMSDV